MPHLKKKNWYFIFQKMVAYVFLYSENSNYQEHHYLAEFPLDMSLADKLEKSTTLNTNPLYVIDKL